jgi:hypothetical protein
VTEKSERLEPSMPCHTIPGHAGHDVSKGIFLSSCLFQALACFSLYVAGSSRHCCAFVIASSTSTYMFFFSSFFFFFFFLLFYTSSEFGAARHVRNPSLQRKPFFSFSAPGQTGLVD